MLRSDLCDYADSYILVKGTITITGEGDDAAARQADERDNSYLLRNISTLIIYQNLVKGIIVHPKFIQYINILLSAGNHF